MSDPAPHDDDRLSAYLDGELDPAEAAELEARLEEDPALAAHLDAVHDVVVALRGLDEVDPPDGYTERLRARIAENRARSQVTLADPAPRRRVWLAMGSAAAAVTLVGLLGGLVTLRDADSGGGQGALSEAARAPAIEQRAGPAGAQLQETAVDGITGERAVSGPVIVGEDAMLPDEPAVRAHLSGLPEATSLFDIPLDQVADLAAAHREAVRRAPPLRSGVAPSACLDLVAPPGQARSVVARVEAVNYAQQPALAYVVVSAPGDATTLDRIEAWLVDPRTCATRLFLTL